MVQVQVEERGIGQKGIKSMKKHRVREGSIADVAVKAAPTIAVVTLMVAVALAAGLMNSWELGLI